MISTARLMLLRTKASGFVATARFQSSFSPAAATPSAAPSGSEESTSKYDGPVIPSLSDRAAKAASPPPLSVLPLSSLVRSLAINSISASPSLFRPSLAVMERLANSQSPLLDPDRNPLLRWLLKRTVYTQFCAGESPAEVGRTVDGLKKMGYRGVILNYAREIVLDHGRAAAPSSTTETVESTAREIDEWRSNTLATVRLASEGDFVAVKFTGAGSKALFHLTRGHPPPPRLEKAITAICDLAQARTVRLLFDAEQTAVQPGIDTWSLDFMRRYNKGAGLPTVYGTYQAYLKSAPTVLAKHLTTAAREGFTLGVKLVRGAYMASDPRHLINDTKADTDQSFDAMMEALMRRDFTGILPLEKEVAPSVALVIATHNHASIRRAQEIHAVQAATGQAKTELAYAQLLGMADDLSCELLQAGREAEAEDAPQAYKYMVWGSTGECVKYLHRRATENRDAASRTRDVRDAMAREWWRRIRRVLTVAA
ncbi:MAG: proline dehydrogenase [Thelocarpon impressellum]|nr:MAG: proline dehydrogenase [Thelocarpon impressellum]